MKFIAIFLGMLGAISSSNACTDLSGEYLLPSWKILKIEQVGCESVKLTRQNYGGGDFSETYIHQSQSSDPVDTKDFRKFDGNELTYKTTLKGCEVISLDVGSYRKTYFGALLMNVKYTSYVSKSVIDLKNVVLIKIK